MNIIKTTLIIAISLLLFKSQTFSQDTIFPYILTDISELESYNANPNLGKLMTRLAQINDTNNSDKINIIQIGASHVQAGVWTFEMRKLLEKYYQIKEASLGLVFPYNIAKKSSCPYYYEFSHTGKWEISKITDLQPEQTIGIMGITAFTHEPVAELSFKMSEKIKTQNYLFDKITIFHNAEDTIYALMLAEDTIVTSIIQNLENHTTTFLLNQKTSSFNLIISQKDSVSNGTFLFYGALLENSNANFDLCGIGINGASTSSYFKANLLFKQMAKINPDMVIFSIGINDAVSSIFNEETYYINYKMLIDSVLSIRPDCAIILTTNNDFYNYKGKWNANQETISNIMCRISNDFDVSFWDMYKIMGGEKSINKWRDDKLAQKDRIHFTSTGYKLLANLLVDAIIRGQQ
jgi:lysophospholipase L1-like esterase